MNSTKTSFTTLLTFGLLCHTQYVPGPGVPSLLVLPIRCMAHSRESALDMGQAQHACLKQFAMLCFRQWQYELQEEEA